MKKHFIVILLRFHGKKKTLTIIKSEKSSRFDVRKTTRSRKVATQRQRERKRQGCADLILGLNINRL